MRAASSGQGFALVMALWAFAILAVITGSVISLTRVEGRLVRDRRFTVELRAASDAAICVALMRLTTQSGDRPPVDGTPFSIRWDGQDVRITIQDESGKVDLNQASLDLLVPLLTNSGLDGFAADEVADKIMDWREPGFGKRLNGAKSDDYRQANYAYGPRNGPFETMEELKLVMGMTTQVYERLAPLATVYSQNQTINLDVAPSEVLSLLPGMNADRVAVILDARANRDSDDAGKANVSLGGHAFDIRAEARGSDTLLVRRRAEVRLTGYRTEPMWIYKWE